MSYPDKVIFDIFPYFKNIDGYSGDVAAGEHDDNGDENCSDTLVSLRSRLSWPEAEAPSTRVSEDMVDTAVEDTEDKKGNENHDDEVAPYEVVMTIGEVLS